MQYLCKKLLGMNAELAYGKTSNCANKKKCKQEVTEGLYKVRGKWQNVLQEIHCVRKVAVHLDLWGAAKSAVYRDSPHTLNELKAVISAFI
jgi:hypothetical protein